MLIIYSHSLSYVQYNDYLSSISNKLIFTLGQLVVTMFLFYSGYGVFEQYKKKGKKYINDFAQKRIIKTLINFDIIVILYSILFIVINKTLPLKQFLLSLIGWESMGNSNWYIFVILILYGMNYVCFQLLHRKNKSMIKLNWILSILLILFLQLYKGDWWYNTILCFPAGMTYSYYKKEIEKFLSKNKKYIYTLMLLIVATFVFKKYQDVHIIYYELLSISFSLLIVLLSMKIQFDNKLIKWFGDNLFYVYIIQRFPMILLNNYFDLNCYIFFIISFICTIVLVIIIKFGMNLFWKKIKI